MKDYIEERAVEIAYYIIEHKATVRQTAKEFGVSKSTIHKDCTDRLEQIIIRGQGCGLYSARDFEEEVDRVKNQTREHTNRSHSGHKNYLLDSVPEEVLRQVKKDE